MTTAATREAQSSADSQRTAPEGDADADESGRRRDRVAPVMPGVGLDGGAANLHAHPDHSSKEELLDGDHDHDDDQRERRRPVMGRDDLADGRHGDAQGSPSSMNETTAAARDSALP
jgi:hypothetical protein